MRTAESQLFSESIFDIKIRFADFTRILSLTPIIVVKKRMWGNTLGQRMWEETCLPFLH